MVREPINGSQELWVSITSGRKLQRIISRLSEFLVNVNAIILVQVSVLRCLTLMFSENSLKQYNFGHLLNHHEDYKCNPFFWKLFCAYESKLYPHCNQFCNFLAMSHATDHKTVYYLGFEQRSRSAYSATNHDPLLAHWKSAVLFVPYRISAYSSLRSEKSLDNKADYRYQGAYTV